MKYEYVWLEDCGFVHERVMIMSSWGYWPILYKLEWEVINSIIKDML